MASDPSPSSLEQVRQALQAAQRFIRNGVALGYIRMPDADCPDTAHETPALIDAALSAVEALGQQPVAVRYWSASGQWRYLPFPFTKGWTFPPNLGTPEPLYASPAALQQQEAGSGWQPIESAPKDRTEILAWFPKLKLDDDGDLTDEVVGGAMAIVAFSGDSWDEPQWLDASGAYYFDDWSFAPDPTQWQPLPPPPGACAPSPTEPADGVGEVGRG